jgi:hypothetical protein
VKVYNGGIIDHNRFSLLVMIKGTNGNGYSSPKTME